MILTKILHSILATYFKKKSDHFIISSKQIEKTQKQALQKILTHLQKSSTWSAFPSNLSYEEIIKQIPIADYDSYKEDILIQKNSFKNILSVDVQRYEPTSGSTSNRKWIPYSEAFISELNAAAAIWLGDTYQQFPKIKNGRHYWSLSWLPQELRGLTSTDDSELFGFWEGLILKNTMLIPAALSKTASSDAAWWATLIYLASAEDLSLISVWSPTYLLKIIQDLQKNWNSVVNTLESGSWQFYEEELLPLVGPPPGRSSGSLNPQDKDFFEKLWPNLNLISAWGSSSSNVWFEELKKNFPKVHFQEKGLWATEGVVSVPFHNKCVLCIENHFYEFIDLQTSQIHPSWQLEINKIYQPIIWNSSGLLRYKLQDQVRVVDFLNQVPCLEFIGRLNSVDMVGEKLDSQWVLDIFQKNPDWKALSLLGCHQPKPHYVLCMMGDKAVDIESHLMKVHHYQLARELGQLEKAKVIQLKQVSEIWELTNSSSIAGQNKIEILREVQQIRDITRKYSTKNIE